MGIGGRETFRGGWAASGVPLPVTYWPYRRSVCRRFPVSTYRTLAAALYARFNQTDARRDFSAIVTDIRERSGEGTE